MEKIERETARYPKIRRDIGLDLINLRNKFVVEVGGGPVGVIADIRCARKEIVEPLTETYKEYWPCPYHVPGVGEALPYGNGEVDVVVITNALDHCQRPEIVLWEVKRVLRPGGWLALENCTNLAAIHPHEGHRFNLDEDWLHGIIDSDFETVQEMNFKKDEYRYGWVKYEGIIGQPAFCGLYRKVTGY